MQAIFSQLDPESFISSSQPDEAGTVMIPHGCHSRYVLIHLNGVLSVTMAAGPLLSHFSLQTPPRPPSPTTPHFHKTTPNSGAWVGAGKDIGLIHSPDSPVLTLAFAGLRGAPNRLCLCPHCPVLPVLLSEQSLPAFEGTRAEPARGRNSFPRGTSHPRVLPGCVKASRWPAFCTLSSSKMVQGYAAAEALVMRPGLLPNQVPR